MAFANENILSGHGPQIHNFILPQGGQPVKTFKFYNPENPDSPFNAIEALSLQDDASYPNWAASEGKVVCSAGPGYGGSTWEVEASPIDPSKGEFKFKAPKEATECPGIYTWQASIVNKEDILVLSNIGYLEVTPNPAFDANTQPISVAFIRRKLRDAHPRANRVLEECEFTLQEINDAIQDAVQTFNHEPPISTRNYSSVNFPWPAQLSTGVIANLLRMASLWYARNDLKVGGTGLDSDDMNKSELYFKLAEHHRAEWMKWIKLTKRNINIMNGFGTVRSGLYPYNR